MVVAGGSGTGKTTFVGAVSDISPLSTQQQVAASGSARTDATMDLDFGRVALGGDLWLYLFGTPGREGFRFVWEDLAVGAIGAIVLVDTDDLAASFAAIDFFELTALPFLVAINCFEGIAKHQLSEIRDALAVPAEVPVLYTDARSRTATRQTLVALVEHAVKMRGRPGGPRPGRHLNNRWIVTPSG